MGNPLQRVAGAVLALAGLAGLAFKALDWIGRYQVFVSMTDAFRPLAEALTPSTWAAVALLALGLLLFFDLTPAGLRRQREMRLLRQRAGATMTELGGRLRLAESARTGSRPDMTKWRKKNERQLVFRQDRLDAIQTEHLPDDIGERFERALKLVDELNKIADMNARGVGSRGLVEAAGSYVNCGAKLYVELATITGRSADWRSKDA